MEVTYSVGIPVRNEESTIVQTLESILSQSTHPREVIVCVNGSTDNTYAITTDMALSEDKIKVITSSPGKANAWNRIVSVCSDNTMMFCDGDVTINSAAAENMIKTLSGNPELVLVGGSNAYFTSNPNTFFSKYFTEDTQGRLIKPNWVTGSLYMTKLNELFTLADKLKIELMPPDIINEDGLLDVITKGHNEIIDSAYSTIMKVSTFHDWYIQIKRIMAGQRQIIEKHPDYASDPQFSPKKLQHYLARFNEIEGIGKKIGVTSLFLLRKALGVYYKISDKLDYNPIWEEATSTKVRLTN